MSNDSIQQLTTRILEFCEERNWAQFHSPKDMAVAIAAEAGELMQHFVWQSPEQSFERVATKREEIASEVADVAILLMEFAHVAGIDLGAAVDAKLKRNAERYPIAKAHGSNKKYNEL